MRASSVDERRAEVLVEEAAAAVVLLHREDDRARSRARRTGGSPIFPSARTSPRWRCASSSSSRHVWRKKSQTSGRMTRSAGNREERLESLGHGLERRGRERGEVDGPAVDLVQERRERGEGHGHGAGASSAALFASLETRERVLAPSTSSTSKSPGLAVRPVSATRAGCAMSFICEPARREPRRRPALRAPSPLHVASTARERLREPAQVRRARGDEELRRAPSRRSPARSRKKKSSASAASTNVRARSRTVAIALPSFVSSTRSSPRVCEERARRARRTRRPAVRRGVFRCSWSMARNFFASNFPSPRAAVLPVERGDELVEREDLLVAVRPAEAREVVEHRVRRVPLVAVLGDAHRAVALGELLAVRGEHHRQVGEARGPARRSAS